jgi:hypothetical protein
MGHPSIDNRTPFAFEPLLLADEDGRPIVAPLVKATFDLDSNGGVTLAEDQLPVNFAGEYHGAPGESSLRYEPETAFIKPKTDVVLVGHAYAPRPGTAKIGVQFGVSNLRKTIHVVGDRHWEKTLLKPKVTPPAPFEKIPLVYERAFGGWDRSHPDPKKHDCEPRNPVGVGFHAKGSKFEEGAPLPNLEDPEKPVAKYGGKSRPAGFGFVSPDWRPRSELAGTYGEKWEKTRSPLLPEDFRRDFFNAASPGLVMPRYLRGNESILVRNAVPAGRLEFRLPGTKPPECLVARRSGDEVLLETNLDTVIVDTDEMKLILLWRSFCPIPDGPHDVTDYRITCENAPSS